MLLGAGSRVWAKVWTVCLVGVGLGACAAEVGDSSADQPASADEPSPPTVEPPTGSTGDIGTVSQELLGGWATGPFSWSQGLPNRKLEPASTHVCVLTRVSGKYRGTGEWIQVFNDGSSWWLRGNSSQAGVSGEATCFPRSGFAGSSSAVRASAMTTVGTFSRNTSSGPGSGCQLSQVEMPNGDAFTFLTGIQGQLAGGGEFGLVEQSPSTHTPSFLRAQTCAPGQSLNVFGRNIRAENPNGKLATFVGRFGTNGDLNDVPESLVGGNVSSDFVVMAMASDAMCAFTRIQGKFFGGGESVQIRAEMVGGRPFWVLRTAKGAGSDYVRAGARCFSRDQR